MNEPMPIGGEIDFLPEGQLKWRCLRMAQKLIPPRPAFSMMGPQTSAHGVEVLILAQRIYSWISGKEAEPSTDADLREEFMSILLEKRPDHPVGHRIRQVDQMIDYIRWGLFNDHNHSGVVPCDSTCPVHKKDTSVTVGSAEFDSQDTADIVYRVIGDLWGRGPTRQIIEHLASAGIKFVSTEDTA